MKLTDAFELYQQARLLCPLGPLLGLDIGKTHIGVAISDSKLKLANPHCVLHKTRYNIKDIASEINTMIRESNARGLVIGYPYLRGKINPNAFHIYDLVDPLNKMEILKDVPYTWWDETYTTLLSERLVSSIKPGPLDKENGDMFAAVGILQGCLDAMGKHYNARRLVQRPNKVFIPRFRDLHGEQLKTIWLACNKA